jgi:hypothetical protein
MSPTRWKSHASEIALRSRSFWFFTSRSLSANAGQDVYWFGVFGLYARRLSPWLKRPVDVVPRSPVVSPVRPANEGSWGQVLYFDFSKFRRSRDFFNVRARSHQSVFSGLSASFVERRPLKLFNRCAEPALRPV